MAKDSITTNLVGRKAKMVIDANITAHAAALTDQSRGDWRYYGKVGEVMGVFLDGEKSVRALLAMDADKSVVEVYATHLCLVPDTK